MRRPDPSQFRAISAIIDQDRVHLLDRIGVGLLDATWPARFPPLLGERLQQLLENPNG